MPLHRGDDNDNNDNNDVAHLDLPPPTTASCSSQLTTTGAGKDLKQSGQEAHEGGVPSCSGASEPSVTSLPQVLPARIIVPIRMGRRVQAREPAVHSIALHCVAMSGGQIGFLVGQTRLRVVHVSGQRRCKSGGAAWLFAKRARLQRRDCAVPVSILGSTAPCPAPTVSQSEPSALTWIAGCGLISVRYLLKCACLCD